MASFNPRKGPGGRRVWQAHVHRRGHPTQVQTLDTKAEADAGAAIIESEIARGVFISCAEVKNTALAAALDRYRREVLPTERSQRLVIIMIRQIRADRIGKLSVATCTSSIIAKHRDHRLQAGAAAQTAKHNLSLLSRVFNLAAKEWGIALPFGTPVASA